MTKLIAYYTTALYQILNPLGQYDHPSSKKTLLGSNEQIWNYIKYRKMENHVFSGQRSDGQKYWIGPSTLFFEVDPATIPLHTTQLEHYRYLTPDIDWLYESLKNKEFLQYSFTYWALEYQTTEYKAEQERKKQEYKQKIRDKLNELGEQLTTETFKLVQEIHNFDHFYHYIDGSEWSKYDAYAKQLYVRLARFPILQKYFSDCAAQVQRKSDEYIQEQRKAKLST